jgi:hypothetical protein
LIVLADFVVGRQLEDHPTLWQAMFHPDILRAEVERKLGVVPKLIYKRQGEAFPLHGSTGRLGMLAIGLVFALPLLAGRMRRWARVGVAVAHAGALAYVLLEIMPVLGAVSVIVPVAAVGAFALALHPRRGETAAVAWATLHLAFWGILVWTLVVVSSIEGVRWNEVALVAMPLDLVLPFLSPRWRRGYARFRLAIVVVASLLCAIGVLRQPLWIPLLVVFLPLAILAFDLPRGVASTAAPVRAPAPISNEGG